jgi:hypothetical protein
MDQAQTILVSIKNHATSLIDCLFSLSNWEIIKSFSNSAFTTSLVGALAGAFAGAMAAQRIAERNKLRDELTKEIRNVNAAMTIALSIASSAIGLKKQYLQPIKEKYTADKKIIEEILKTKRERTENSESYKFSGDLRTLSASKIPIDSLKETVFSRLSINNRSLSLTSAIAESLEHLNYSIAARNDLITTFKCEKLPFGADITSMYFGLPFGEGHVNQEFGDCIEGMASHNNDIIFFSVLLCKDLYQHGLHTAERFKKELKSTPPNVNEVSFDEARQEGLIPKDEEYPTWFSGFQERPKQKMSFLQRLRSK